MTRRTLPALAAGAALTLVALAGCGERGSSTPDGPAVDHGVLHVVATLDVKGAATVVATDDRLWIVSGGRGVVTQVDPSTDSVAKVVPLPHPAGYATLSHGSLWLASMYDDAVMEVDAESGRVLRTLGRTPARPLDLPAGIAATGHDLWVVNHHSGLLLRIDDRTGEVIGTTHLEGHYAGGPVLAGGSLWVAMTKEGIVYQVHPADGKVVGDPVPIDTGLCTAASVVGTAVWFTSQEDPTQVFHCHDGASRLDAGSREVAPLGSAAGRSLSSFAAYAGSLWATDLRHTVYRVDQDSGDLLPALTLPGGRDSNRLFTAFGSLWVARAERGELLRLEVS